MTLGDVGLKGASTAEKIKQINLHQEVIRFFSAIVATSIALSTKNVL